MKRPFMTMVFASIVLAFTSCGGNASKQSADNSGEQEATESAEAAPEKLEIKGELEGQLNVNNYKQFVKQEYMTDMPQIEGWTYNRCSGFTSNPSYVELYFDIAEGSDPVEALRTIFEDAKANLSEFSSSNTMSMEKTQDFDVALFEGSEVWHSIQFSYKYTYEYDGNEFQKTVHVSAEIKNNEGKIKYAKQRFI